MPETTITIKLKNLTKRAFDAIQKSLDKTTDHFERLAKESQQTSKGIVGSLNRLKSALQANQEGFQAIAIGAGMAAASTGLLTKSFISAAMQMEKMKMGLTAVMGSAKAMETHFKDLEKVARLPGLGLPEAVQGSQRLQAVGVSAKEAARQLEAFGLGVARVGGGREELMRVVEQFSQMSAKGKILMDDLRPIRAIMPDINKAMQTAFGTRNIEQIREMGIEAEEFISKVTTELLKLPGVGNTAANSMENLTDTVFKLKAQLGEVLLPTVSKIIDAISKAVTWFTNLSKTEKSIIAWGTVAVAAIASVTAAIAGFGLVLPGIIAGIGALATALTFLVANPIGLAITAIGALVAGFILLRRHQKNSQITAEKLSKSMVDLGDSINKVSEISRLTRELEDLTEKTKLTKEETKRLIEVKKELARLLPRTVKGYDDEGTAIIGTTKEIIGYTTELQKQIELERELLLLKSRRRLPKLEEQIESEKKKLQEMEEILRATPAGKKGMVIEPRSAFGKIFAGKRFVAYDKFLTQMSEQNDKVQRLIKERQELQVGLESAEQTRGIRVKLPPLPEPIVKETKESTKAELEAIAERNKRIWDAHNKLMELKRIEADADREAISDRNKRIWDAHNKSIEIARQTSEEERKTINETNKRIWKAHKELIAKRLEDEQRIGDAKRRNVDLTISLIENEWTKRHALIQQEYDLQKIAIEKQLEDRTISVEKRMQLEVNFAQITELTRREHAELEKQRDEKDAERKRKAQEAYLKGLQAIEEKRQEAEEKRQEKAKETIQRLLELDKQIALAQIENISDDYERRTTLYKYQVELVEKEIENEEEKFKKLKLLRIQYNADILSQEEKLIKDVMEGWAKITAKPKVETKQIDILKKGIAQAISAIPADIGNVFQERRQMERDAQEDILQINRDTQDRIKEIQNNTTLSHIEKLRQIEQAERQSADRRKQIEEDLNDAKSQAFKGYVQSFLAGIARMIQAEAQKRLASGISSMFAGGTFAAGAAMGPAGIAAMLAIGFGGQMLGGGFDNPVHDAMAHDVGRQVAMTYGTSFDNPTNDMRAKLRGTMSASQSLGERSAGDMLSHFSKGFEKQANIIKAGQSQGNDNLQGILGKIEQRLSETPQFTFLIDGRELHAQVRRVNDRTEFRRSVY